MKAGAIFAALSSLVLSACQTYAPAPPVLDSFPAALAARRLTEKPPEADWSPSELLAAALTRNPSVARANSAYRTALAASKAARVKPAMSLSLTVEYSRDASPWLYSAQSDLPLDLRSRRDARWSAADLGLLQAYYDYGDAVWSVRDALARARLQRLSADQEIILTSALSAARQSRSERIDIRVSAGEDARPMALTARAEAAGARHRLSDAQARRDQANIALAATLGVSTNAVTDLKLLVDAPPDTRFRAHDRRGQVVLARRDVLRAVADYDLAENTLRLEVARQYPEVRLGPGYSWDHGVAKLPFNLSLALPPSDLNRASIAQADAKRSEAGRALEATQAQVLTQLDQADHALTQAQVQLVIARDRDLPLTQAAALAAERSLRAGESDRTEELAARAAQLEAELALIDAQKALSSALIDLEDAQRQPFDLHERAVVEAARPGGSS